MGRTAKRSKVFRVNGVRHVVRLEADLNGTIPGINVFIDDELAGSLGLDLFYFGDENWENRKIDDPGVLSYLINDGGDGIMIVNQNAEGWLGIETDELKLGWKPEKEEA